MFRSLQGGLEHLDEASVQDVLESVVLALRVPPVGITHVGNVEDGRQVQTAGLPVLHGTPDVQRLGLADGLLETPEAEGRQDLAYLLGDVLEEVHDELRPSCELLPEFRVLRRHPDRTGVQVADPHHHAAGDDQWGGGEAELVTTQQCGDHHVAARLELAVHLHHDPVPQVVQEQGLLGLCQSQLPGRPGVLDGGERRGTGSAIMAGDKDHVRMGLGDTGGHGANPHLGHELHVYATHRVGVLEVVDELGQVLDGVDVVVGRR